MCHTPQPWDLGAFAVTAREVSLFTTFLYTEQFMAHELSSP